MQAVTLDRTSSGWAAIRAPLAKLASSTGVAAVLAVTLRRATQGPLGEVDADTWMIFFTVVGVTYAVVVGFLVVELLSRHHRLSVAIHGELNAIEDVRDYLLYVDDNVEAKERIVSALRRYVECLIGPEWERMSGTATEDGDELGSDTSSQIYEVTRTVEELRLHDASDEVALTAIIQRLADVTTHRTNRLELAGSHLSPPLRTLVVFLSAVIVGGFVLMPVGSLVIHLYMVSATVLSIHLLYMVLDDLSRPFRGVWRISQAPFRRLASRLADRRLLSRAGVVAPSGSWEVGG